MGLFDNWTAPEATDASGGGIFGSWGGETKPSGGASTMTPLEGGLSSTLWSIPELFGIDAPKPVQDWRAEHPVMDLATSLIGMAIPYAGVELASTRIPRAARALEGAQGAVLKSFGTTVEASPVVGGAVKEMLRYSPLELSRLGTGWAVGDEDMSNMFMDVGLSTAIAGSLGGLGGFLRAGGQAVEKASKLAQAEFGLLPNFEFRLGQLPESTVVGPANKEQFLFDKMQEALKYVPEGRKDLGLQGRYLYDVQGLAPADVDWIEGNLLKPNHSRATAEKLAEQAFDVRQLHSGGGSWAVGEGFGDAVAKQAGLDDLKDLAGTMAYPRWVKVQASADGRTNGAGQLGAWVKRATDSGALKQIADDTWMMQEEGGLWTVMKWLKRGDEPPKPVTGKRGAFQFGPAKVRVGDELLIGKTDLIGKFAPDAHKVQGMTMDSWAKLKDPLRQLATSNPFNQEMNLIMRTLSETDWMAARTMRRQNWATQVGGKLANAVKAEAGLVDNAQIRAYAEGLYDIVAPKLSKMITNPTYGRMYTLLEGAGKHADSLVSKVMFGAPNVTGTFGKAMKHDPSAITFQPHDGYDAVAKLVMGASDDAWKQVMLVSDAQMPAKELKAMSEAGTISPEAVELATKLQAINKNFLEKNVIPALEEAGRADEVRWLEGYIMPRVFKGDSFIRVVDEEGKPQFIANGMNPAAAQERAQFVIDEAKLQGKTWKASPVESYVMQGVDEASKLDEVYRMVHEQMGQSADAQAIVGQAMRKLMAEQTAAQGVGMPKRLVTKRTGLPGTPDVDKLTREEGLAAIKAHYTQLARYAAVHTWKNRFGGMMAKWGKGDEVAYADLNRKALQWLGREGQWTTQINKLVNPVLGNVLGPKSATKIANATNKLMYHWNLGIMNPSFALLNLLQPLQTVAPWVSFMQKAPTEEAMGLMQMLPRFNAEQRVAGAFGVLAPLKVLREAVGLVRTHPEDLKEMFQRALADGVLAPHLYDEFVGPNANMAHKLRESFGRSSWDFIADTATAMSTKSEQWSRLISFNSAYLVGKRMFKLEGDQLYRFTRKAVEQTMYGYSVMDRSRVLTGPLGSMWGLFKNWQFHFIADMARYAGLGLKDGVWEPMLWQGAAALSVGGLGATPLVLMADGLAKWNSDSPSSFLWMKENWGSTTGDALYFGFPGLLGLSLQASSALPGTDVVQDMEMMGNIVAWERAKAAFGAIGAAADHWEGTGENPLKNPNIADKMMQAFAPRAAFRAMSALEGDYVRSMSTGQPTVRDLPMGSRLLHGIGFNPVDVEQNYIVGETFYQQREKKRDAIQDLGEAFAQAQLVGDSDAMDFILRRAMVSNVDVSSVLQSANTRYRRETEGDYLGQFDKGDQADVRPLLQ